MTDDLIEHHGFTIIPEGRKGFGPFREIVHNYNNVVVSRKGSGVSCVEVDTPFRKRVDRDDQV